MIKKYLTVCSIFATSLLAAQDNLVIDQNFDGEDGNVIFEGYSFINDGLVPAIDPAEFQNVIDYFTENAWAWSPEEEGSDNSVLWNISIYPDGVAANDWFITPNITLPEDGSELRIKAQSGNGDALDGFSVYVSTEAALAEENTADDFTEVEAVTSIPTDMTEYSVDLSAYNGQAVFVAIVHNTAGATLTIDDLKIGSFEFGLGIADNAIEGFSMYPNPANNKLNISAPSEISSIEVVNTLGQVVMTKEINALENTLNIEALNTGNYILKVTTNETVASYNFIKE